MTVALTEFHGFQDSVRWRIVPAGVEIEGTGVERTRGKPVTVTRIWEAYADAINIVSRKRRVPCALILATICTESGGNSDAVRQEPGYVSDEQTPHKISAGLMQTLISTAREAMQMSLDRAWLLKPENSIEAGTAYICQQTRITGLDPPLVAAAYNAGRLAHQSGSSNRWKLRQYPIGTGKHCDRFVQFFNDAVFVLSQHSVAPAVGIESLLGQMSSPPRSNTSQPSSSGSSRKNETLSGTHWISQFPGSRDVSDLESTFQGKVKAFIAALHEAGAKITINCTYRSPARAYLMHWCWKIAKDDFDPRQVPSMEGVSITWWHGDLEKSVQVAQEMVTGYGMQNLAVAPALRSRHIQRRAIDMSISWAEALMIRVADGSTKTITSTPRDGTNLDLIAVGKTYGVIHFNPPNRDRPHWSEDGR